jgi:hypothetical protein
VVQEHQPVTGPALGGCFLDQLAVEPDDRPRHSEHRAVRTSVGPGPGHKRVPAEEAGALVTDWRAAYGKRPATGYLNGGRGLQA